jgi:hypothetical protein
MKWTDVKFDNQQVADVALIPSAVDVVFNSPVVVDVEYGNMKRQDTPGPYPEPDQPPGVE